MKSRRILAVCLLFLCWSTADAQFFKGIDEWLRQRQARQPYDTTYIYRPQERWLVRERSFFDGQRIGMVARTGDDLSSLSVGSGLKFRQSFGFGYRNINLDIGFNPFKTNQTLALDVSTYGNRLCFTGYFGFLGGMSGLAEVNGTTVELPRETVGGMRGVLELCYSFNGSRFSMAAARAQSYRQLRSAGSLLALASAQFYGAAITESAPAELTLHNAISALLGLGLGYGYNWVPSEHWLIHLCLTETVGLLNYSMLTMGEQQVDFREKTPVLAGTAALAVCYYYKKFYFSASSRFENLLHLSVGDTDFFNGFTTSQAVLSAGIRF